MRNKPRSKEKDVLNMINASPAFSTQNLENYNNCVVIDWSLASTAEVLLSNPSTNFSFIGATNKQKCLLIIEQYSGNGSINLGSEVRYGSTLTSNPIISQESGKRDYLGFIYNELDGKYDFVSLAQGY